MLHNIRKRFANKAVVLMYHRIAEPVSDVWEISVSPEKFKAHLKVLKQIGNIVPLQQLADQVNKQSLKKNQICITFDDGYIDNFEVAKPLLEKYNLPATFFISSGNLGTENEFWWDELEHIILFSPQLPYLFSCTILTETIEANIEAESILDKPTQEKHYNWKACSEAPPTQRAMLFYRIWQQLRPLTFDQQQMYLHQIRNWADVPPSTRIPYQMMPVDGLKKLAGNNLFTIGVHTITHPALAYQTPLFQEQEIVGNRHFLEKTTGQKINLLAYPYGNYNSKTIEIVAATGLSVAFTTEEENIHSRSNKYGLGRFQVKNITGNELSKQITNWRK